MPKTMDPFWRTLLKECKDRGMSYADIGNACDVSRSTAYAWFHSGSEPTLPTVRRLARAVGYKLELIKVSRRRK